MNRKQDQFRGCLLGMAAGDALGYCVEDQTLQQIQENFGPEGILGYDLINGYAQISANTQLAMFTANGLLFGATRGSLRGVMAPYARYMEAACRDWAKTQRYGGRKTDERICTWLYRVTQLHARRHPDVEGKSKNLVVSQSHKVSCFSLSSVEVGSNRCAGK